MARPGRFELPTLCLEDKSRCAISLLFLGSAYFLHHRFAWHSGVIGPKLDPTVEVTPSSETNSLGADGMPNSVIRIARNQIRLRKCLF